MKCIYPMYESYWLPPPFGRCRAKEFVHLLKEVSCVCSSHTLLAVQFTIGAFEIII